MAVIVTSGDDIKIKHTVSIDGVPVNIPNTATVTSRIVSDNRLERYTDSVIQASTSSGADWPNGAIMVLIPATISTKMKDLLIVPWVRGQVPAVLETQVDDNGRTTFYADIVVALGNIA